MAIVDEEISCIKETGGSWFLIIYIYKREVEMLYECFMCFLSFYVNILVEKIIHIICMFDYSVMVSNLIKGSVFL